MSSDIVCVMTTGGRARSVERHGTPRSGSMQSKQVALSLSRPSPSPTRARPAANHGGGSGNTPGGTDEDSSEESKHVRLLLDAARKGKMGTCKHLVESLGLDINRAARDGSGLTPLACAVSNGKTAAARYFIDKGADLDKQDDTSFAPLHHAAETGRTGMARLLLSRGACVDIPSSKGTPLHIAASQGKYAVLQILLDYHANPDVLSTDLCTPIAAVLCASPEKVKEPVCLKCVKHLVKANADLNPTNHDTPLVIATKKGLTECVTYLLEAGADANIPSKHDDNTPIEIAAKAGRRILVEILFPFTSPIKSVLEWSVEGIISHVGSPSSKGKVSSLGSGAADDILEECDNGYGLFANIDSELLKQWLNDFGTVDYLRRRANKTLKLKDLKQKPLQILCAKNGIPQLRCSNEEMRSMLSNHKKKMLEKKGMRWLVHKEVGRDFVVCQELMKTRQNEQSETKEYQRLYEIEKTERLAIEKKLMDYENGEKSHLYDNGEGAVSEKISSDWEKEMEMEKKCIAEALEKKERLEAELVMLNKERENMMKPQQRTRAKQSNKHLSYSQSKQSNRHSSYSWSRHKTVSCAQLFSCAQLGRALARPLLALPMNIG